MSVRNIRRSQIIDIKSKPGSAATITASEVKVDFPYDGEVVCLALFSSHDSGASGVVLQASFDDGVTWRTVKTFSLTASAGVNVFQGPTCAPKMRWRYTNSANVLTAWEGMSYFAKPQIAYA